MLVKMGIGAANVHDLPKVEARTFSVQGGNILVVQGQEPDAVVEVCRTTAWGASCGAAALGSMSKVSLVHCHADPVTLFNSLGA